MGSEIYGKTRCWGEGRMKYQNHLQSMSSDWATKRVYKLHKNQAQERKTEGGENA